MNNIHLFPPDVYGLVLSYAKQHGRYNTNDPAYRVMCVMNPRTITVPVPLTTDDIAKELCTDCKFNRSIILARHQEMAESQIASGQLPRNTNSYWIANDWVSQMENKNKQGTPDVHYPVICSSGLKAIKRGECQKMSFGKFLDHENDRRIYDGIAEVKLPLLAVTQAVIQKPSGSLSIAGANRRELWTMCGFSETLPEPHFSEKRRKYREDMELYKADPDTHFRPRKKFDQRGVWLAPFTMANVYDDGTICWGRVRDTRHYKTHKALIANFFANNFNSDLSSTYQDSIKYTLENFDIHKSGKWSLSDRALRSDETHGFCSTSGQYEGLFVTDREWLLQAIPPKYHIRVAGSRCVIGWFKRTGSKKHVWVNCNGYIVLMAGIKNKCKPIPLGPATNFP